MRTEDAAALLADPRLAPFLTRIARLTGEGGPSGADWLAGLPRLIASQIDEWGLALDGEPLTGRTALVLPVRDADSRAAALKLLWPHDEAAGEHLALRAWDGRGAVRLLRADPARSVLLLERLTARDLTEVWTDEACEVVGGLYRALHIPALPALPRLSTWARRQADRLERAPGLPRRLVAQARSLIADLTADPACDATLIHTDLHSANVLDDGTDWVAIDPKPLGGHPAFEVAPMLWNRADELGSGPSLRWSVRHRLEILCEVGGLVPEEARDWTIVREVVQAAWASEIGDRERVSLAMALIKAVGD
ncbi:aminoglycoside phosphotransferase family protein [Janibacter sp. GXQ6167]|uniref:aminoglycoside phosphotransferase family protein n=1 Tax=Janibacter sp. GXQ6167 TaxID=3240791 RepID=UPI003525EBDF